MLDFIGHVMTLQIQFLNQAIEDYMDIFSIYNTIYIWNVVECDEAKIYVCLWSADRPLFLAPTLFFYGVLIENYLDTIFLPSNIVFGV